MIGICYWKDAQSLHKGEDLPLKCPIMRSIGVITKKSDYTLITSLLTPDGQDGAHIIVPNGCVVKIRKLHGNRLEAT